MSHLHALKLKLMTKSTYLPIVFLVALGFSIFMFRFFPVRIVVSADAAIIIGVILFIIGTPLILLAERERHQLLNLSESFTCEEFFVGIYKYSRHPGTLGFMLLFFGFGFFLNSAAVIICAFIHMVLLTLVYIPLVEGDMVRLCGEGYEDYKKKVRMWL